jgi:hypothetical protein
LQTQAGACPGASLVGLVFVEWRPVSAGRCHAVMRCQHRSSTGPVATDVTRSHVPDSPGPECDRLKTLRHYDHRVANAFFDTSEREQLCSLLEELGPDAPTLLAPWTTRDLVAHLVLRERDMRAAPGLVIPGAWARLAERRRLALRASPFDDLVATVRRGPPLAYSGWVWYVEWGTSTSSSFTMRMCAGQTVSGHGSTHWLKMPPSSATLPKRVGCFCSGLAALDSIWSGLGRTTSFGRVETYRPPT